MTIEQHDIRCTADMRRILCRMYDGDKIVQLLERGKDVISPPEFHKSLNREYKASTCLVLACTPSVA